MKSGRLIGGIILIFIGIVSLLANFGLLPSNIFVQLFKLWPLILIIIGIKIFTGDKPLSNFSVLGLVIVMIVLFSIATLFAVVVGDVQVGGGGSSYVVSEKISNIKYKIRFGGGNFRLEDNVSDEIEVNYSGLKIIDIYKETGDKADFEIKQEESGFIGGIIRPSVSKLGVKMPQEKDTYIDADIGASKSNINLDKINTRLINLNIGASDIKIRLGSLSNLIESKINAGASIIKIEIPSDSGVKIYWKGGLSGRNFPAGFKKDGARTYKSDNYDYAANKIHIDANVGVSSFEITQY